jgi:hypothetical protein
MDQTREAFTNFDWFYQGSLNKSSTLHLSVFAIFKARTVEGT